MICAVPAERPREVHFADEAMNAQFAESSAKRRAVLRALEITAESLRARLAQAMTSEAMLDQLYNAIQPDGTLHL